jgi:hypothetical protein
VLKIKNDSSILTNCRVELPCGKIKGRREQVWICKSTTEIAKKKLVWDPTAIRWINYLRPDLKPGSFSLPPTRPRNSCTDLKERNRLTSMLSTGSMGVLVGECK